MMHHMKMSRLMMSIMSIYFQTSWNIATEAGVQIDEGIRMIKRSQRYFLFVFTAPTDHTPLHTTNTPSHVPTPHAGSCIHRRYAQACLLFGHASPMHPHARTAYAVDPVDPLWIKNVKVSIKKT